VKNIFIYLILSLVLLSCKKYKEKHNNVTTFTASSNTVDFSSAGRVDFNASFSHSTNWTLTITGEQSGAVSTFTGTSSSFQNIEWKGYSDNQSYFMQNEKAIAVLTFDGRPSGAILMITITNVPEFKTNGCFASYGDFETPSKVIGYIDAGGMTHYSYYWAEFNFPMPIANETQGIDSIAIDRNGSKIDAVQGNNYYYIKGVGAQPEFVSGLQYYAQFVPTISTTIPADPSRVWVNFYLYGSGDENAEVDVEYQEADADGSTPYYQGSDDDTWVAHITLKHKGWKLFSVRYSDLIVSSNAALGGSGNHIMEPNKIVSFSTELLKKTNSNAVVEMYFDYPIITVDGPFKPF
jgi:hypothetical protein